MDDGHARFTGMYEQFYRPVLAYALRRVPAEEAREVVDEAFLIAWRRLADVPNTPLPWLLVTTRNLISDLRRRGNRREALVQEIARISRDQSSAAADDSALERITVLGALAGLTESDREALILTVWDGLGAKDAAFVLGISAATFAVRLHRARRRFASRLRKLDGVADFDGPAGVDGSTQRSGPGVTAAKTAISQEGPDA